MAGYIAQLFAKIGVDTSGLRSGLNTARGDLKSFGAESASISGAASSSLSEIVGVIGKIGVAFGTVSTAIAAGKKVFDFGVEGAQIQRLADAGEKLARKTGESFGSIVAAIRKASLGMVAEADIMLAANRAMMLGVGQSAEEMAKLMEIAAFRARAMGLDTTQAFNDIVTGIGRQSPMILDNLGIVVDAVEANKTYAASIGTVAEKLTEAQRRQALLNVVLQEGGRQVEEAGGLTMDAAGSVEAMNAAWKNFGDTWKIMIAPISGDIARWLTSIIDPTQQIANNISNAGKALQIWTPTVDWGPLAPPQTSITIPVEYTQRDPLKMKAEQDRLNEALATQSKYMWDSYRASEMTNYVIAKMPPIVNSATREVKELAKQARNITINFQTANLGIAQAIERDLKQIDFVQAGGLVFQNLRDKILENLKQGLISNEEAEAALSAVWIAAQQLDVKLGNMTWNEFQRNLREKFGPGSTVDTALTKLGELIGFDGKKLTIDVLLNWIYGLPGTPGGGGAGLPAGPGSPRQNPTYQSSLPPGTTQQVTQHIGYYNNNTIINNYDQGTAATVLSSVRNTRRNQLISGMPSYIS